MLGRSEKGVRSAQKMRVGPCTPVVIPLEKAEAGPTSGPTYGRLSHSRETGIVGARVRHTIVSAGMPLEINLSISRNRSLEIDLGRHEQSHIFVYSRTGVGGGGEQGCLSFLCLISPPCSDLHGGLYGGVV
jgi:hypothetical protein